MRLSGAWALVCLVAGAWGMTETQWKSAIQDRVGRLQRELSGYKLLVLQQSRSEAAAKLAAIRELLDSTEALATADWASLGDDSGGAQGADGAGNLDTGLAEVAFTTSSKVESCAKYNEAKQGHFVKVHYVGRLLKTEKVFTSSFHTGSMPVRFVLGAEAPDANAPPLDAWNLAVAGMCVGERRDVRIPWSRGYGDGGSEKLRVPPKADLQYFIELVEVSERPAQGYAGLASSASGSHGSNHKADL